MNDEQEIERRLMGLSPPGPAPALRERVLNRVAEELRTAAPRTRSWARAVAAALLLAVGLSWLADTVVERRLAVFFPAEPISRLGQLALDDDAVGIALATSLWMRRSDPAPSDRFDAYQRYLTEMTELSVRPPRDDARYLP